MIVLHFFLIDWKERVGIMASKIGNKDDKFKKIIYSTLILKFLPIDQKVSKGFPGQNFLRSK